MKTQFEEGDYAYFDNKRSKYHGKTIFVDRICGRSIRFYFVEDEDKKLTYFQPTQIKHLKRCKFRKHQIVGRGVSNNLIYGDVQYPLEIVGISHVVHESMPMYIMKDENGEDVVSIEATLCLVDAKKHEQDRSEYKPWPFWKVYQMLFEELGHGAAIEFSNGSLMVKGADNETIETYSNMERYLSGQYATIYRDAPYYENGVRVISLPQAACEINFSEAAEKAIAKNVVYRLDKDKERVYMAAVTYKNGAPELRVSTEKVVLETNDFDFIMDISEELTSDDYLSKWYTLKPTEQSA